MHGRKINTVGPEEHLDERERERQKERKREREKTAGRRWTQF